MIEIIADNVTSPLGMSTAENYSAVVSGMSKLQRYENFRGIPQPITASVFSSDDWQKMTIGANPYERLVIHSITEALSHTHIDVSSPRTLMVFSTTKGNVEGLEELNGRNALNEEKTASILPSESALRIAKYLGNPNTPITVSNACISGVAAQLIAMRALKAGRFDNAVISGADLQSKFILSGFLSIKTISSKPCRPFDIDRNGLNPGEACATIIMSRVADMTDENHWYAVNGAVCNDAFHISNPSKKGEGCFRAILKALSGTPVEDLALVNAHGTATLYNDEMEAVALNRAGLSNIPVNSLKGYYGHTMGAAGLLETIISMHSIDHNTILGTRGFAEMGVSKAVNISSDNRFTDKRSFLKIISGFGGGNAAILYRKGGRA